MIKCKDIQSPQDSTYHIVNAQEMLPTIIIIVGYITYISSMKFIFFPFFFGFWIAFGSWRTIVADE